MLDNRVSKALRRLITAMGGDPSIVDDERIPGMIDYISGLFTSIMNGKQNALTAGPGISIVNGVISVIIDNFKVVKVQQLPQTGEILTMYLVPKVDSETGDVFEEYIWIDNDFELIGSTRIDLSEYALKTDLESLITKYEVQSLPTTNIDENGLYLLKNAPMEIDWFNDGVESIACQNVRDNQSNQSVNLENNRWVMRIHDESSLWLGIAARRTTQRMNFDDITSINLVIPSITASGAHRSAELIIHNGVDYAPTGNFLARKNYTQTANNITITIDCTNIEGDHFVTFGAFTGNSSLTAGSEWGDIALEVSRLYITKTSNITRGYIYSDGDWVDVTGVLQSDLDNALSDKYSKPSGGIPKTDLASTVQASLEKADSALQLQEQSDWNENDSSSDAFIKNKPTIPSEVTENTVSGWGFTKNTGTYSKPSGGIPDTDLSSGVQTSLGKADTALQSHQSLTNYYTKSQVESLISSAIADVSELIGGAS